MTTDSTKPGYLLQENVDAVYDEALDRILSRWIRQVVNYPPKQVRPRWQKYQTSIDNIDTDWCAFGVIGIQRDATPALVGADDQQLWRHETIDCMASFYGPNGMAFATQFSDAVRVEQNNETLKQAGLTLASLEEARSFPELINTQWVRRYDVTIHLRRKVVRTYAVKSFKSAPTQFFGE